MSINCNCLSLHVKYAALNLKYTSDLRYSNKVADFNARSCHSSLIFLLKTVMFVVTLQQHFDLPLYFTLQPFYKIQLLISITFPVGIGKKKKKKFSQNQH